MIARRKTTSTKCVLSLLLFLLAWLLATILGIFEATIRNPLITGVLIGGVLLLALASFVMGIVGLVDYGHHNEYTQGRAQAIWAIVLTVIPFLAFGTAVLTEIVQDERNSVDRKVLAEDMNPVEGYTSERFGYSIELPGEGWHTSEDLRARFPRADFVARFKTGTGMLVAAFRAYGATVDIRSATAGLMSVHKINFPDEGLEAFQTRNSESRTVQRLRYSPLHSDTPWRMLSEVHLVGERAFLVSVWTASSDDLDDFANTIFKAFRVLPDPDEDATPLPRAVHQAGLINKVGLQTHTTEPERTGDGFVWLMENPPVYEWAPKSVPPESWLPMVYVSPSRTSWDKLGAAYLERIDKQLKIDRSARELATSLVEGLSNDREKTLALANYVQQNITYKAIEFGRRSTTPNAPGLVLTNRYGDCKDHAVLLHGLLEAAGIESRLVLVKVGGDILPQMPTLDQFNHMIVGIPEGDEIRFIDTTDQGYDLRRIPTYPEDSSGLSVERRVVMLPEKKILVEETVTMTGMTASFERDTLLRYAEPEREDWCQRLLDAWIDAASLKSFELDGLFDTGKPLKIQLEWEATGHYSHIDDKLLLRLPVIWEHISLDTQPCLERQPPFKIPFPLLVKSRTRIQALAGHSFKGGPQAIRRTSRYSSWALETKLGRRTVELIFECHLTAGEYPAEEYEAYHRMMDEAIHNAGSELQLVRE